MRGPNTLLAPDGTHPFRMTQEARVAWFALNSHIFDPPQENEHPDHLSEDEAKNLIGEVLDL